MSEPMLSAQLMGLYAAPCAKSPDLARERPSAYLKIETHPAGERMTVVVIGEIDMATFRRLRRSLRDALAESVSGVDLDLTRVSFCDCAGLNVLLDARQHASAYGRTVTIGSAGPAVVRLLALSDTSSLFAPTSEAGPGIAFTHVPRPGATHSTTEESPLSDDAIDATTAVAAVDTAGTGEAEQELRVEVVQLKRAMETRPVIDLARGVLMASFGLSPEDAWTVLVTVSQNTNIKLHHLAESTVAAVQGEPLPEPLRQQLSAAVAELVPARQATTHDTDVPGPVPEELLQEAEP
ncbi:ANTAR domain-containing protein [Streptomyces aurantiacus]|nr:ANTAR domain-containing protein [Streptomyces aurantiacus]